MNVSDFQAILDNVHVPKFDFHIIEKDEALFLVGSYMEKDIVSGKPDLQKTRKWYLSPHMTKSEFVQTCFKCYLTSLEHQARENFQYRPNVDASFRRVFGPHFDVDALHAICEQKKFDYRPAPLQDGVEDHYDSLVDQNLLDPRFEIGIQGFAPAESACCLDNNQDAQCCSLPADAQRLLDEGLEQARRGEFDTNPPDVKAAIGMFEDDTRLECQSPPADNILEEGK